MSTHNLCFGSTSKKNRYTPAYPSFCYLDVGYKRIYITSSHKLSFSSTEDGKIIDISGSRDTVFYVSWLMFSVRFDLSLCENTGLQGFRPV